MLNFGVLFSLRRYIGRIIRIWWPTGFERFERVINKKTWSTHEEILRWAERAAQSQCPIETNDSKEGGWRSVSVKGLELRKNCLDTFSNKLVDKCELRILIHTPSMVDSPGGASVFNNLAQSLSFLGIETQILPWKIANLEKIMELFRPSILLTSDHCSYIEKIDWNVIKNYRENNRLRVGLTASLEEYGNTTLPERLRWAQGNFVDFYYSFRAPEHLITRSEYNPFYESGYKIYSVEFGANILQYYPILGLDRDIDYVFLASSNPDKWPRYFEYLPKVLAKHAGFLDGPGWTQLDRWAPQPCHRYLYARAKVGLNLHIQDSIDWPSELNERTYILAASGVPQLVDHPMLLNDRFNLDSMFVAETSRQYAELFEYMLADASEARRRALIAMDEVYARHTTFHRAEKFAVSLLEAINA